LYSGEPLKGSFSIADWLVEPELNAISNDNETVHLEPKVMKVLLQLAAHHGQVLSKEELMAAVWPDVFVTDDVLTRCISMLRREMRDDTHTPRYIQTIPKVGYRLVAEVRYPADSEEQALTQQQHHGSAAGLDAQASLPREEQTSVAGNAAGRPLRRLRVWHIMAVAISVAAALIGVWLWHGHHRFLPADFRVTSLTSYPGKQDQAAFSPEGSRIVFVWTNLNNGSRNLFIKQIGSETLLRLTHGNEYDFSPAWSPDGAQIAYLSVSEGGLGLYLVSSLGGPAQKLYTPHGGFHWEQGALSWSQDGKSLAFPDGPSALTPSSINLFSMDTLQGHAITSPPHGWDGDFSPVFSPDGRSIAFIRAIEGAVRDIYVMPAGGCEPRQLTHDRHIVDSLTWSPDSNSIIFSSDRGGSFGLWKVAVRGGEPERLAVGTEDAFQPAVSRTAHRLLYTQSSATWSILGFRLRPNGEAGKPSVLASSTLQDSAPALAPDGSRFAFQSWRSGAQELWIASKEGLNLRQLTSGGSGLTGSPAFSPDGQQIAFDSRPEGHSHIFVVAAAGGTPRQLTSGSSNDILPRWSADGQSVYFASNRSGTWQSWKIALHGDKPHQVTANGGYVAMESSDRRWIYYTKVDSSGIWRIPVDGGPEVSVLPQPQSGYWGYWTVARRGIYFLDFQQPAPRILLYDPETGKTTPVATLDRRPPPFSGVSVNRNEDELLITDEVNAGSHIILVENFL
jgi:Tol biopolymer transport system component/DNA-binding winged helix-turn-helix (wHTH) protein